ncbi:hypothetical protein V2W45_1485222, partial [Cenococcum geophilum]
AKLPRIIRDAVDLVVTFQERFLWVDSLCTEQDNAAQKHGQIAQMDNIFHCGILFDHPGLDYNYVSRTSEFVLLSRTKLPTETNTRGIKIVNGMGQNGTIFD